MQGGRWSAPQKRGFIMSNEIKYLTLDEVLESPIHAMALSKAVNLAKVNDDEALPSGASEEVKFGVILDGTVVRGIATPRRGTNRALTYLATVSTLHKCGFMRENILPMLVETWANFGGMTKKELESYRDNLSQDEQDLFAECERLFQEKVIDQLPKITPKGGIKFHPND